MKKILIIAHFCGDLEKGDNGRYLYIASKLADDGNDVEVVTSSFFHREKKQRESFSTNWPFRVSFLKEPGYEDTVCLRRLYSHLVWGKNLKKYLAGHERPDTVYCAVPSLTGSYFAMDYCRRNGIRFVIDVQDLWPEAFHMVFKIPLLSDIIFKPITHFANKIYSAADEVFAVSRMFADRVLSVNKKCSSGNCVFLGTNLETFQSNAVKNPATDKKQFEFWLAYCGTLGYSYDLICVFDALAMLKERGKDLPLFVVMGDGPKRDEFEAYAGSKDIPVKFTGWLSYEKMCGMLCASDVAVNPIVPGSYGSIINKHADYASSGLPVINTQECEEYRELIDRYHMGINCRCGNSSDVADALTRLMEDENLRHIMGENSLKCAKECFDRRISYQPLFDALER